MNKIFLFAKHAKISKNCDKLSKSVSYETLVGGTTTKGSADEQTQCLNKGCAGYRFCKTMRFSYENLVDCLSQTSYVFRLVKVLGLAAVLSIGMLSESRAACDNGYYECSGSCVSKGQDCYLYDDQGRVSEIITYKISDRGQIRTVLNYDDFGNISGTQYVQNPSYAIWEQNVQIMATDFGDGNYYVSPSMSGEGYSFVIDKDKKNIIVDGSKPDLCCFKPTFPFTSYAYANGVKESQTSGLNCSFSMSNSGFAISCPDQPTGTTQYYAYEYDDYGNIVAEYLVPTEGAPVPQGATPAATHNYTENYLTDSQCNAQGNCTSCAGGYLKGNKCVSDCGAGELIKDGKCISDTGSCGEGYFLKGHKCLTDCGTGFSDYGGKCGCANDTFLKNGKCANECGTGEIGKDGICVADTGNCGDGYFKKYVRYAGNHPVYACVSDCGLDSHGDHLYSQNGQCIQDGCDAGYLAKNYNCVTECGDNYLQQNKYCFSEEEGCKGLYVNENGQCVPDGWEMTDDGYIIIGDNLPDFDMDDALGLSSFTDEEWENLWSKGFICRGDEDKCREILSKYNLEGMTFDLLNDVGLSMAGADSSNCNGFGYSWSNGACTMVPTRPTASSCSGQGMVLQGGKCVSTCGASFKLNDGECDRIRYTPAEAAQYLKDTDNEIIMTFKVNR